MRMTKQSPETWQEALEQFIWWKQAGGLSERTVEDYRGHIERFFKYYPEAYSPDSIKRAALDYMCKPAKPAYFNLKLIYLRAFIDWCMREGIFPENPLAGIKKRKAEDKIVDLSEDTLKKLLTLPNLKTFAGLRDHALILMTLDCGIRPSEALGLIPADVSVKTLEVHIPAEVAKTRTSRTLPLSSVTVKSVQELISVRHPDWDKDCPLFCSVDGIRLQRQGWGIRLKRYSQQLGVKIEPYYLRHTFALRYLRAGGNVFSLQKTLGHTDIAMTKRYVALSQSDLRDQHQIAAPLSKIVPDKRRVGRLL